MQNWDEVLNWYRAFTPEAEQRKNWYGNVANAYDRVRPKYASEFIDRTLAVAKIPPNGRILEVGCGPGTATISIAKTGVEIVALEPSLDTFVLACQNLADYPNVEVINSNFEEYEANDCQFDAILAATSWHWVSPESKHTKAAALLKDRGNLILLWNTGMQPPRAIFDRLVEPMSRYIPSFAKYKEREELICEIGIVIRSAIESGLFTDLQEEDRQVEVNYAIEDYLLLLTTYSPVIALSPADRGQLLIELRSILAETCGENVPLSYFSIFNIVSTK